MKGNGDPQLSLSEQAAAIEVLAPSVDQHRVEQAMQEHLAAVNAGSVSFRWAADLAEGFQVLRERLRQSGSVAWTAPRWIAWTEERSRNRQSGGILLPGAELGSLSVWRVELIDREILLAARRSASHPSRAANRSLPRVAALPRPVGVASFVADALRDEHICAEYKSEAEPLDPGSVNGDWSVWHTAYERWKAWHEESSTYESTRRRLPFYQPLLGALGAGLLCFWVLAPASRRGTKTCVLVPRPRLRVDEGRLHCWDRPAVEWREGARYWFWRGVRIWREVTEKPSRLTAAYIARTRNIERRRVLLERLGYERFLKTARARSVSQDDFGKLWKTELKMDGEPVSVVELVNATAEPDGSHKRYFLRVPPATRTAREAVAWSFGFHRPGDYLIAKES